MYLWNTKALATKLKTGELSQADRFKYLFLGVIMFALIGEVASCLGSIRTPAVIEITESIIVFIIIVGGTLLCYKANKRGDNKEFIDRYICLTVPIFLKLMALLISVFIVYIFVAYKVLGGMSHIFMDLTTWIDSLFTVLFEALFYWRLIKHIGWVSDNSSSEDV